MRHRRVGQIALKWFENVSPDCRGTEPALYVSRIQNTYDNYVKIVQ